MAITTLDQLIAGFDAVGYWAGWTSGTTTGAGQRVMSSFPYGGVQDTTLDGVAVSQSGGLVQGTVPFYDPTPSPDSQQIYLAKCAIGAGLGWGMLCDRLWHNGGYTITSTSVQSSTPPSLPPRDRNGSSDGVGVMLGLEVSVAVGAAAPTVTVKYTNDQGTTARTGGLGYGAVSGSGAGFFYPINLQSGDFGVRKLESIQLSASWVSGTINMVAYRPLAMFRGNNEVNGIPSSLNFLTGFAKLYPGTTPFIIGGMNFSGVNGGNGMVHYARG
jgi:hypothetical protein